MLVEFGRLEIDSNKVAIIACTAPIGILEKLAKIDEPDMKIIVDKQKRVFVEIPDKLFEDE